MLNIFYNATTKSSFMRKKIADVLLYSRNNLLQLAKYFITAAIIGALFIAYKAYSKSKKQTLLPKIEGLPNTVGEEGPAMIRQVKAESSMANKLEKDPAIMREVEDESITLPALEEAVREAEAEAARLNALEDTVRNSVVQANNNTLEAVERWRVAKARLKMEFKEEINDKTKEARNQEIRNKVKEGLAKFMAEVKEARSELEKARATIDEEEKSSHQAEAELKNVKEERIKAEKTEELAKRKLQEANDRIAKRKASAEAAQRSIEEESKKSEVNIASNSGEVVEEVDYQSISPKKLAQEAAIQRRMKEKAEKNNSREINAEPNFLVQVKGVDLQQNMCNVV